MKKITATMAGLLAVSSLAACSSGNRTKDTAGTSAPSPAAAAEATKKD